jgi:serine/threonine-protein kinase
VSPQNILLSEQGEVKLTDFGIAKAMGKREQTGTGVVKGKVAFMAPEQALGKAIDARSDLFAVGVVLYQLMTGVRPFEAPTDLEVLLRVQKADFRPPHVVAPDLPPHVSAIISRAMQLDPDMRYQSAEEMLTDIEKVLRTVFRPVGQTELKRWLAALGARDGHLPMAKAAHTPPHGRIPGSTGEMEGKDVELDDVDGEAQTSLASIDEGEIRPRMSRQRGAAEELALPVPQDDEAALSGRMSALEFPLPIPETEERPGRRRGQRGGGFGILFLGLLVFGGAAFASRYFGLLQSFLQKETAPPASASGGAPGADKSGQAGTSPEKAAAAPDNAQPEKAAARAAADAGAAPEGPSHLAAHKPEEPEPAREPARRAHGSPAEKPERLRHLDEIKSMEAPDPSREPAPAPSEPPSVPPPPAP